jgi:hypothetical protein
MGVGVPEGWFTDESSMDKLLREFFPKKIRGSGGENKNGVDDDRESLNGEEPINQFTPPGGLAEVGDFEVPE